MIDIPDEVKRKILQQKLTMWHNTVFDAQVDVEMAEILKDAQMEQSARESMNRALKAVKLVEKKLSEIDQDDK